jgi:cobalt-zinc-cadmium efflux system membrane fusion protein
VPKGGVGGEQIGHTETDPHEAHDHSEGHGENADEEGLSLSLDEIASFRCEHQMPAYQCASCRYEVGVVKVPPSLVKEDPRAENGLIRTRLVEKIGVTDGLTVTGEVQLNENTAVHISPRIPGIIESVKVDMGAHVREGDVLFDINSVELGKALSDYERSRSLAALAAKTVHREESLFKSRISSEQEMIDAQMTYEQHKAERDAARQVLHVLGLTDEDLASIDRGEPGVRAGSLPVRAPLEGTIIEKHAVVGELVERDAPCGLDDRLGLGRHLRAGSPSPDPGPQPGPDPGERPRTGLSGAALRRKDRLCGGHHGGANPHGEGSRNRGEHGPSPSARDVLRDPDGNQHP